ncbi:hypothetical protein ACFFWD_25745 [Bradyrhizobium erythrophlei]|uniref:hypothetical protein n=1 Tax=Bradyrhizobium erythrophlei TaxID=1437360 RepID=UPI0035E85AE4
MTKIEFEYKLFKISAEKVSARAKGWRIDIKRRDGGEAQQTVAFGDLSDVIDEAKRIIDAASG